MRQLTWLPCLPYQGEMNHNPMKNDFPEVTHQASCPKTHCRLPRVTEEGEGKSEQEGAFHLADQETEAREARRRDRDEAFTK